jgi:hypothetical protein
MPEATIGDKDSKRLCRVMESMGWERSSTAFRIGTAKQARGYIKRVLALPAPVAEPVVAPVAVATPLPATPLKFRRRF